jgi:hypothetical protein
MLRARDALVAARTELVNATRGLVKSMGARLPQVFQPELRTQSGGSNLGEFWQSINHLTNYTLHADRSGSLLH